MAALAATLDLAQRHGRYLEVTIFADTKSFDLTDDGYRHVADQVGAICATHSACALVEIANEVWSLHDTQAAALGDLAFRAPCATPSAGTVTSPSRSAPRTPTRTGATACGTVTT